MHPNIENHTPHYIAGHWVGSKEKACTSFNPIDNTPIWIGNKAGLNQIKHAIDAASTALKSWSLTPFSDRQMAVIRFGKIIEARQNELTLLIAKESGKPLWEAATETTAVISKIQLSINAYQTRTPEHQRIGTEGTSAIGYKPLGVVAVLGPFNFPAHLSNGHIVPALLAGNTIIYKPSELTPNVAEFIMQCWHDSDIPNGVINCLQGDATTAKALLQQDIQAVYFTGSYQTGLLIHRSFAERPNVLLALEMGGNNPLIIDEIDDIDAAVYQSILSSFITAGQRCTCARRLIIKQNAIGDQFLKRFIEVTQQLAVGPYTQTPEPFMGSVISHEHALMHLNAQESLLHLGGKAILPMQLQQKNSGLLTPGIIDMQHASHPIDEEIFAPIVQIYRYKHFDEALKLANQTRYGLIAGLICNNKARYLEFYQTAKAGIIHWNKPTTGALSTLPFGGLGQSGNHRPSGYFAADYCSYPVAIQEVPTLSLPSSRLPGITL